MSSLTKTSSDYQHHYHDINQISSKIRNEINGQRPSPLKITKDSHLIRKPSNTSSSSFSGQIKQQRQPVIIYDHSPKVIHTQARDFMALVQKLTGFTPSDHSENKTTVEVLPAKEEEQHQPQLLPPLPPLSPPPPSSSSRSLDDNDSLSAFSDDYNNNTRQFFANIPLFTPNAVPDYFCSPKVGFRFPESGYVTPSPNNSISPSVLEFFKGLPDY